MQIRYAVADVTKRQVVHAVAVATEATSARRAVSVRRRIALHLGPIVLSDVDAFRATVDLNITGTFLAIRHFLAPVMARTGGGSIIGMSSIAGAIDA